MYTRIEMNETNLNDWSRIEIIAENGYNACLVEYNFKVYKTDSEGLLKKKLLDVTQRIGYDISNRKVLEIIHRYLDKNWRPIKCQK